MNNKKMINTAKNLDILVNVGGKIAAGFGIACIALAILVLILEDEIFTKMNIYLDLDFIKFYLSDASYVNEKFMKLYAVTGTVSAGILCFLIFYSSKLLRNILSPMKEGRPFESGIAANLRKIGWVNLFAGLLIQVVEILARVLLIDSYSMHELFKTPAISKIEFSFTMNFNFIVISCIIFFLSYIFTYGQALQQESDETL